MASIYRRGDSPFLWMKWRDASGKLHQEKTRFRKDDPEQVKEAERAVELLERQLAAERRASEGVLTVRGFSADWLKGLRARGVVTADQWEQRFRDYVHTRIGDKPLREVNPDDLAALVASLGPALAPRTILNIYGMLHSMFELAVRRRLVPGNPCALEAHELPKNEDRDPSWRALAVFSRGEVERLLSDQLIRADRRALYAMLFLAGVRIGEALARRWADYDAVAEPLGKLLVPTSWSTVDDEERGTKTRTPREVPVHPVLAQALAEWRLSGWVAFVGRTPTDGDLIFPARSGEHRSAIVALERLHSDLQRMGLRRRNLHDSRRTFISLAQADGAPPHLLKWVTHGGRSSVMDLYTVPPWAELCAAVTKLRIRRLGAAEATALPRAVGGDHGMEDERGTAGTGDPPMGVPRRRSSLSRLSSRGVPPPGDAQLRDPRAHHHGGSAPFDGAAPVPSAHPSGTGATNLGDGGMGERGRRSRVTPDGGHTGELRSSRRGEAEPVSAHPRLGASDVTVLPRAVGDSGVEKGPDEPRTRDGEAGRSGVPGRGAEAAGADGSGLAGRMAAGDREAPRHPGEAERLPPGEVGREGLVRVGRGHRQGLADRGREDGTGGRAGGAGSDGAALTRLRSATLAAQANESATLEAIRSTTSPSRRGEAEPVSADPSGETASDGREPSPEQPAQRSPRATLRICDAAVAVLRETGNPAVMATDSGLLHQIADRAGRPHKGFRTEKLILDALSKQPGELVPGYTRAYRNQRARIFRLPEGSAPRGEFGEFAEPPSAPCVPQGTDGTAFSMRVRVPFRQPPEWDRRNNFGRGVFGSVYAKDRCCWCYREVKPGAPQLRLTRTEDGEWFVVVPPSRPELPDERTFQHFTLPIGPDCLRRHPEFRPGLVQAPASRDAGHVAGDVPPNFQRSEGTQRTGRGSAPEVPPAIGASAPADPPLEVHPEEEE